MMTINMPKDNWKSLLIIISLIILFLALPALGSQRNLAEPVKVNADPWCYGAPECYKLDENGNEVSPWILHNEITKKDVDIDQLEKIRYAWIISRNIDFILTINAESSSWDTMKRSYRKGVNGYYDYGLCQLSYQWHKPFIDSPEFRDWQKQLDYCWKVWQDGIAKGRIATTFYGYQKKEAQKKYFIF